MRRFLSFIVLFFASCAISMGLARLSMPVGSPMKQALRVASWTAPPPPIVESPRPLGWDFHSAYDREIPLPVTDPMNRACDDGLVWACRALDDLAATMHERQRLGRSCDRGHACSCVEAAKRQDGAHLHEDALGSYSKGCSFNNAYACAHAGARQYRQGFYQSAEWKLAKGCELDPAAGACRYLGFYWSERSSEMAARALYRGCLGGDGGSCLSLADLEPRAAWRERAEMLLEPVCEDGVRGHTCPAESQGRRVEACGKLAIIALERGDADRARAIVSGVIARCDDEEAQCDLWETLPLEVLTHESWRSLCLERDVVACRITSTDLTPPWWLRDRD